MLGLRHYRGVAIDLFLGDICCFVCDALVTAANTALAGGGGVDGAIHRAGGPAIALECRRIGGCPTGQAVITTAGQLPSKKLIHAVGPVWQGGGKGEAEHLRTAYRCSLELAAEHQLMHIAIPSISTGAYGFPIEKAAPLALATLKEFCDSGVQRLRRITLVSFDSADYRVYQKALFSQFPEDEERDG